MRNNYVELEDIIIIHTQRKGEQYEIIIDADDFDLADMVVRWHIRASNHDSNVYAQATYEGHSLLLHRLLMNPKKGEIVFHLNGNGLDCRRANMEIRQHRNTLIKPYKRA